MSSFVNFFESDGFLGTTALMYMDFDIIFIVALPFLIGFSLFFALKGEYERYILWQETLFSLTFGALLLFIYGIYINGIELDMTNHFFSSVLTFNFLVFQIFISVVTIGTWFSVIQISLSDYKRRVLPGMYSDNHERSVKRVYLLILLTTASSVALYLILFFKI